MEASNTQNNEMEIRFDSRSENEGFARVSVASFLTQLNPTVEEVADVKTAVSEAVTNAIIHGYEQRVETVRIHCSIENQLFTVEISDRVRLDDGQCGQRAAALGVTQLGRALQQAAVQVENVAGVSFTSRRTADQQRQGTVSNSVLGQVIIDDEDMLALLHEVLAHGAACVGGDILQRRQLGRGGTDDGCVRHSAVFLEILDQRCHGRALLTDGNIDAQNVLALLVDDGIGGNDGLAGLAVTDDKLTLAAANRNHRVDGLNAGLQRLLDGLTVQDAGCRGLNGAVEPKRLPLRKFSDPL